MVARTVTTTIDLFNSAELFSPEYGGAAVAESAILRVEARGSTKLSAQVVRNTVYQLPQD
jgi:hypothetical protein